MSINAAGLDVSGSKNPNWKGGLLDRECAVCGKEISVYKCRESRTKFCSSDCHFKWRSEKMKNDGNSNWNDGMSRLPYPHDFKRISKEVIKRDGKVCQNPECSGNDSRMVTHHINYNKEDCRQMNLIALCSSCNTKANFGRDEWQAFYTEIMAKKDFS